MDSGSVQPGKFCFPPAEAGINRERYESMRYCQFCGTKLEDGVQCACEGAQEAARQEQAAAVNKSILTQEQKDEMQQKMAGAQRKAKDAAMGLWGYLKAYFAAPARAVQDNARQGVAVSLLLTVIRVLAMGLAVFGVLRNICASISSLLDYDEIAIGAPFLGSLLYGGPIAALTMALFILALFAVIKLQGGGLSLRGAWQASAGNGVLPTALLLVSFLLSFISLPIALAFVALSVMASLSCGALTVQFVHTKSGSGQFWLMYFVAVIIIVLICRYAVPNLLMNAVGEITVSYEDKSIAIGPAMAMMKEYLSAELFEDTFDQIVREILRSIRF